MVSLGSGGKSWEERFQMQRRLFRIQFDRLNRIFVVDDRSFFSLPPSNIRLHKMFTITFFISISKGSIHTSRRKPEAYTRMIRTTNAKLLASSVFIYFCYVTTTRAFVPPTTLRSGQISQLSTLNVSTDSNASSTRAPPRTGLGQKILNFALESPLWKLVLVPQARETMVKTAEVGWG